MDGITESPVLDKYGYFNSQQGAVKTESDNVFLKILVEQLKNQDPLEPSENGELIQQMASFSTVEETSKLNQQLANLVALQEVVAGQNAFTQSAELVGKNVKYIDPESGDVKTGFVSAVNLDANGLSLDIDGVAIPLNAVTGLLADEAPDDPGEGGEDDNENDENDNNGLDDGTNGSGSEDDE